MLSIYQGMEEFIACGIYHSHFTGCATHESYHCHYQYGNGNSVKFIIPISLNVLGMNVFTRRHHRLSLQYILERPAKNVHRLTASFYVSL